MRDIMEHVLKLYSYLYGTCNRHSRLTEGRRRLSSYSFDDQNEFQSSLYPNSFVNSGLNVQVRFAFFDTSITGVQVRFAFCDASITEKLLSAN